MEILFIFNYIKSFFFYLFVLDYSVHYFFKNLREIGQLIGGSHTFFTDPYGP